MIRVTPKELQKGGYLFGRALYENRPISFPQGGRTDAYSNLFYWAHITANNNGTFGLHPHQGFEIMTFILQGALEHYDTKTDKWTPLTAGGVQVIRAGSGVQHAEKFTKGSRAFQIWFDPDMEKALLKEAEYKDYKSGEFTESEQNGYKVVKYIGSNAPIASISEGVSIEKLRFVAEGTHQLLINTGDIYSIYVIEGEVAINEITAVKDSYVTAQDEDSITLDIRKPSELFIIKSPKRPSYRTYADKMNNVIS